MEAGVENGKQAYSEKFIEDMVKHAKYTLQIFGKQVGVEHDNNVQLCENYPLIVVPSMLLRNRDMEQVLMDGQKSASSVFRKLIGVIISDVNVWAESKGAKDLFRDYESEIGAVFECIGKIRASFVMKD